jgi:hypothetical protein
MRWTKSLQRHFAKIIVRLFGRVMAFVFLTLCQANNVEAQDLSSTPGSSLSLADEQLKSQELIFHITDFGINQGWEEKLQVGDSFSKDRNRVFPELNDKSGAQLLVPMPSDHDLASQSQAQLADNIAFKLLDRIRDARKKGTAEFEIQIVQHINTSGYFDPCRSSG